MSPKGTRSRSPKAVPSPTSAANPAVWFQLTDGRQMWTYWDHGGPPALEAVRHVAEMRQLMTKILAAAQVQSQDKMVVSAGGDGPMPEPECINIAGVTKVRLCRAS